MYSYAFKRIGRSWALFIAFFLGLTLAVSLFTGTLIGADSIGYQTLQEAMTNIPVDVAASKSAKNISSSSVEETLSSVLGLGYVDHVEAMYRISISVWDSNKNFTAPFTIVALPNTSTLLADAVLPDAYDGLGINQTYLEEGSVNASKFTPGDVVALRIRVQSPTPPFKTKYFLYNLTLSGNVKLSDNSFSIAASMAPNRAEVFFRQLILGGQPRRPAYSLMIISEESLAKILTSIDNQGLTSSENVATILLMWLDHDLLVKPWDISQSILDVQRVQALISNSIRNEGYTSLNLLTIILNAIQQLTNLLMIGLIILALPVFFTAWYMGRTVSDVSLNLRRREIGLILTKGFSKNQVLRLFITETLILSLIAGGLGIFIGVAILPLVDLETSILGGFKFLDITTIIFAVVFSAAIAILSVYSPARKASNTKIVDAIREYAPEESLEKPRRRWPTIAMLLGLYKILAYVLGFSLQAYSPPGKGFLIVILFRIAVFIDQILGYVAPVLFFWGFSKLFIQGSFKLQESIGRIANHFMGDLSEIATENAKRNTRRTAAVAFLVALIIGYGVSVIGGLASTDDYIRRSIYNNVGADISVSMFSEENATLVKELISDLTEVSSATIERWLFVSTSFGTIQARSIDPSRWQNIAYNEPEWFTGTSSNCAFTELASSNETIILDRSLADDYGLSLGENVTVTLGLKMYSLRIVGFFGLAELTTAGNTSIERRGNQQAGITPAAAQTSLSFWSYIPEGLFNQTTGVEVSQIRILVKLASGVNGTTVEEKIETLNSNIERVDSVETQRKLVDSNIFLSGPRRVQALGVPFALLVSSIGVVLIAVTTMRERRKEVTLMAIKGFAYGQIVKAQLLENLGVLSFSILLGVLVGYVTTMGNVQSQNLASALVARKVVFPISYIEVILVVVGVVLASVIVPVIILVRKYSTSLEWRIRG